MGDDARTAPGVCVTLRLLTEAFREFEVCAAANASTWRFRSCSEFFKESLDPHGVVGGGVLEVGGLILANSLDTSSNASLEGSCICDCCSGTHAGGGTDGAGRTTPGKGVGGAPDGDLGAKVDRDLRISAKTPSMPIPGDGVAGGVGGLRWGQEVQTVRSPGAPRPASAPLAQGSAAVYSRCRLPATERARQFLSARPPPTWYLQASDGSAETDSPSEVAPPPSSFGPRHRPTRHRLARRAQMGSDPAGAQRLSPVVQRAHSAPVSHEAHVSLSHGWAGVGGITGRHGRVRVGSELVFPPLLRGTGFMGPLVASVDIALSAISK
ncbi:hypothetical protein NDU88_009844 [Pleurodeles waltl]|uniref:Uncharacterized protein n=1 Tax=Pleurodeles waltl TaxID=8319 RepID=A0AAV7S0V7_PLEWA|nr:hypothetical protein NDU88_009844 [Pleurodeles waltl]